MYILITITIDIITTTCYCIILQLGSLSADGFRLTALPASQGTLCPTSIRG